MNANEEVAVLKNIKELSKADYFREVSEIVRKGSKMLKTIELHKDGNVTYLTVMRLRVNQDEEGYEIGIIIDDGVTLTTIRFNNMLKTKYWEEDKTLTVQLIL